MSSERNNSALFDQELLNKLYRYAYTLCMNKDDAYDLLQYALEKYLCKNHDDKYGSAMAYVRVIIRNRFIDEYRKQQKFPEDSFDDDNAIAIDVASLEQVVLAQVELEIVWEKLDIFEREILYYWAVEEMTAAEISTQINVPRGTILSRIYRLRKKIQAINNNGETSGDKVGNKSRGSKL